MALLYIDETQASLNRADVAAGEVISEGEFIVQTDGGQVTRFDPASDALPHGIVVHHPEGDSIVEHDEDYVPYSELWEYDGDEGDKLYYQPLASVDQVMPETLSDNGNDPEPSLAEGREVGIVTINGETEIVEAGYTDNGGTQYGNGGTGDYVALGRIDKDSAISRIEDNYDIRVPVRLDADLFQP